MKDKICDLLAKRGFRTEFVSSERERSPGVQSEVCMVYAARYEFRNAAMKRP